jgi:WD40 repeat protein
MRSAGLAAVVVVLAVAAAVALRAAPQIDPSEIQLQAAVNKATVEGDLKGAILDFQKILNTPGVSRPVAANALLHLGQCHEKLGSAEARNSYERVLKDFADQSDVVRQARERLATLAKAAAPFPEDALKGRRIIGPLYHLRVAVSPDGRYLAYCCSLQAPNGLVVHDLQTGRDQVIAAPVEATPVFSPDSGEIAYVAQKFSEAPELRIVKRTGTDDSVLFKRADVAGIALFGWMPNGKDLLVRLGHEDKSTELALIPLAGGAPRTVKSPSPYTGPAERGHLSSDGKYLAYRAQAGPGGAWVTRVFTVDTGSDAQLLERPASAWNIGWTGDGRFAFYSAERESEGIWAVKVANGKAQGPPERIAGRLDESIQPVGVSRGGAFFYQNQILDFNIHLMSVAPSPGALKETRVLGSTQSPDWSPDGRSLAYAQTGSGLVRIQTLATGATRTLWTGLPGAIMSLKWYPDQSALAAQGVGPEGGMSSVGLRRVDLASGALSDIVLGRNWAEFGANPTFSADGKSVTYKAFDYARQVSTLTRYNLESRAKDILLERKPPEFVSGFSVSQKTGQIAVAVLGQNEPSSLGLLDPSSREFRIIHKTAQGDFIPASLSVAWMPDGKSLLFVMAPVATNGVPMSLYRIPVSGGQAEKLFEADGIWQVRVHPDGRLVAIETRSYKFETLVADKLFAAARK